MDDRHLSGEEKRRRMKEEFKKDLQLRQEFLEKVKGLRHSQRINRALEDMNQQDDTQDWIDKLNGETAFMEAKTEIALEAEKSLGDSADFLKHEAELQKAVAESMVEKMKQDLMEEAKMDSVHEYQKEDGTGPDEDGPKKTLGDF